MSPNIYLIDIIIIILEQRAIFASRKEIYKVLFSDSHFPSLAAVSTTLSYFGLTSNAYLAHIEDLKDMNNVLLHTNEEEGHFYIMNKIEDRGVELYDGRCKRLSITQFKSIWDGVILVVDKKEFEYREKVQNEKLFLYASFILLLVYSLFKIPDDLIITFIANIFGLACAFILFNQQVNIYEYNSFCKIGRKIDCNYVSQKNPLGRWIPIGLPVIGIYFFLLDSASLVILRVQDHLTLIAYVCSVVLMIGLTIYQFAKIKKYCLYCMGITFMVIIKLLIITSPLQPVEVQTVVGMVSLSIVVYIICHLLYINGRNTQALFDKEITLLNLKRDKRVLSCYFEKIQELDIPKNLSLNFGNINAPVTITTIISIDCKHCKTVAKDIYSLMQKFPQRYHWQLIIDGIGVEENNKETFIKYNKRQLNLYMLYLHSHIDCLKALFANSYREQISFYDEAIVIYKSLLNSIQSMNIQHYPFVLINSYRLPKGYKITDIPYISRYTE